MKNEENLKRQLTIIKENSWTISNEINPYDLALEMLDNIGAPDSILRDSLIFKMFQKIILNKQISPEQMKNILELCLSKDHLFYGLGKTQDDSVFNRTFTLCVIEAILTVNNEAEREFLNKSELLNVYKKVMDYSKKEKDLRGYVEVKGWAHSTAHTSDVLCALAESKFIKYEELVEILTLIKDKICITTYTYINEEDERLINTFMCIYNRNILKNKDIINWIYSFENVEADISSPAGEHLRENRKVFLRSLFFRARKFNLPEEIINAVNQILNSLPAFF